MQPLLTIAVPTYNGSRTIRTMMDFLMPQVNDCVEILIIDNCSTDDTPDIIHKYLELFPQIRHIRNAENIGADGNFLKCMREARGKYIHLLSDDDVLVENSLQHILDFLASSPDMGLVYLGTANFYSKYTGMNDCKYPIKLSETDICTNDKELFFEYAKHYWGFVSSFIISSKMFNKIVNPEQYFGTYWLQSYIHISCANSEELYLGVVKGLCVAAGVYITQSNYDTSFVDGISYRKMLDFAVDNGFNKKQLDQLYINRLCLLASHGIIKEKATGKKRINRRQLFTCTKKHWKAWLKIYPMMLVPSIICKFYMKEYRKFKGVDYSSNLNRDGDVSTRKS